MPKLLQFIRPILFLAAVVVFAAVLRSSLVQGQTENESSAGRVVITADLTGAIGPASAHFLEKAIEESNERGAELLVLRINTPGGLVTSMREMISTIIASPVPIVGYVAPSGAHAASAGTYILYSTHVAAMAPGTNLGAATPIQVGGFPGTPSPPGQDEDKDTKKEGEEKQKDLAPKDPGNAKAVNDAVAFIRSLAELRGRNAEWAEKAVREAATLSARAALGEGVIEIVAADMDELLGMLNGRRVAVANAERTLTTTGARVERIEPGLVSKILAIVTNPNVALILMMIGIYGLIFEFANPGSIGPGVIGVICLIIGLYSLNQLPLDYAGLALLTLGVIFMTIEAFTPSFGVFGFGGIAAFVIGATMLIDTDVPAYQLSWSVIAGTAVASGALLILVLGYVWRAHQHPVRTGRDQLKGAVAEVLDWSGREGHVWAAGERWQAISEQEFNEGEKVRVTGMNGITLQVARNEPGDK